MAAEARVVISSRAGLAVLAAIAFVLALVAVLGGGSDEVVDRSLIPGLDVSRVDRVHFQGPADATLVRRDGRWSGAPAAVDTLLAALRGAHWHRKAELAGAGKPRAHVVIAAEGWSTTLTVGAALPGSGQTWLAREHDAVLVDDWVAHALAPEPLELVERHPLASAAAAERIIAGRVALAGHPRRITDPQPLLVDPALVKALEDACASVEIVAPAELPPPKTAALVLDHDQIDVPGPCPGRPELLAFASTLATGCVDPAPWRAVTAAMTALDRPAAEIVDRRPLPAPPERIVLPDGTIIDRAKRPQVGGKDADPDRVAELVAALTAPADVVPLPQTTPTGTIATTVATLDLYDHILARHGEPLALRPSKQAWATITRPAAALRDPTRWLEEPTTISTITIDGKPHHRGATLGQWTDARDPALLEALATALSTVRAPDGPNPGQIRHRIDLTITAPTGTSTHTLQLGDHCAALADSQPVILPLSLCTAITAAL